MITPEFKSYVNAMQRYIEGYPVQSSYEGDVWDDFVGKESGDPPVFDDEYWRVKPGNYIWTRLYSTDVTVGVEYSDSKDYLVSMDRNWIDEPRLVRVSD